MKKNIRVTLMVINLIFVTCAFLLTGHCLMTISFKEGLIRSLLTLITLVFSLFYILMDYKKTGALYYKRFMVSYMVLVFARAVQFSATQNNLVPVCALLLSFGAVTVLTEAKDLGRRVTMLLGLVVLICSLGYAVWSIMTVPAPEKGGSISDIGDLFDSFANAAIAIVMNIMIAAKYSDKTARGRN